MNLPVGGMLVFFALFWSAITLFFDGSIGRTAVRQLAAQSYTVTDGTVIASSVATSEDSDGDTTYRPEVTYRYRVGERELVGDHLSYNTMFTSGAKWARNTVAELAPNTPVRVYYNPADPTDSVLRPGLDGSLLFLALFMTPFNAVMFTLWAAIAKSIRLRFFRPPAGGIRINLNGRGSSIQLEGMPALGAGLATIAGLAFVGMFAIAFLAGGFHPSLTLMTSVWAVLLTCGVGATLWQSVRNRSDRARLLIDEGNAIIDLPPTRGRTERLRLAMADLTALHLSRESTTDSEGSVQNKYALAIQSHDRSPERIAMWSNETQTRGFGTWLAAKLGVELVES